MAVREATTRTGARRWIVETLILGLLASGAVASCQTAPNHEEELGAVHFPVSCAPAAQTEIDHAVALLHHMTYPAARASFERAGAIDSQCAMAHWGIAMTLFQPLWPTRPGPDDLRRGWEEVQMAQALAPATERELLLVEAAAAFFREPASTDYWQRIQRWQQAMDAAHAALPDDLEISVFDALAILATAPSDRVSREHADRAAALLLSVYERNPDHPGVMHYLVHANDTPGRQHESLGIVRKYESIAPHNPHALHMPTHIYTRLGDWQAVIDGNLRAAEAALQHPAGDRGQFVWDEFPHAIEYLVYAYLQIGADGEAAAQVERLHGTAGLQPTFKTAFHLASTGARHALERHAWGEAAVLAPRQPPELDWDRFTWPEGVTWFARGLGAARLGDIDGARTAASRLAALESAADESGEELFGRNIRILRYAVEAWLAQAEGGSEDALARMHEAVDLEIATPKQPVTPAPTIPANELLGDLLLEEGRPSDAVAAYERSLQSYPRRLNSLLGAARASREAGDASRALTHYQELLEVAGGGTREPVLEEARAFVAATR